jgi:adenylate cyclase
MISEDTKEAAGDLIEVRALDIIQVMGKEEGIKVYELLGRKGEVDPQKMEVARTYEKGLELHWQREWDRAIEQFKKALEIDPEEGPSQVLIARCEEYGENPPGPEWEGVYTMKTK